MKISKEVKSGFIAIIAIALLITGVNFLKGYSFFGGDDVYYAYFPNSGGIMPASSVTLNGVPIGKIIAVDYVVNNPPDKRVKITFNIQDKNIKIPVGSEIKVGSLDLFNKGIIITMAEDLSKGFYKPGARLDGVVAQDMLQQVQAYADPITQKLQSLMSNVDKVVTSLSSFWDDTATSELEESMKEVKIAIKRLGNVAVEVESFVQTEKVQLNKIFDNVESITNNLKRSNEEIRAIIGNTRKVTDDLVTADFKTVIADAKETIQSLNTILADAASGKGTLGKLVKDETFYNELVKTNQELQDLVADLKLHPERYIHFSVLGAKSKGVTLTPNEEKKLRQLLDTLQ
ncbi:MAG: MlaD family protein [Bacteroidota bacterium]